MRKKIVGGRSSRSSLRMNALAAANTPFPVGETSSVMGVQLLHIVGRHAGENAFSPRLAAFLDGRVGELRRLGFGLFLSDDLRHLLGAQKLPVLSVLLGA